MRRPRPEALSHTAALLGTVAVGAVMLWRRAPDPEVITPAPPLSISLLHEDPPPQPPATPPRPSPLPRQFVHPLTPSAVVPVPDLVMVPVAQASSDPDAVTLNAPVAPAPAPKESPASIEAEYAAALRTNIDSRTTSPNSAEYRLLKPHGSARVSFTLSRDGTTGKVSVTHTSGSGILDRQALTIVQSGHYPPFPERAFPGETSHVFIVTIEFQS